MVATVHFSGTLKTLSDGPFKDKTVHVAVKDKSGARRVETLANLVSAAAPATDATSGDIA